MALVNSYVANQMVQQALFHILFDGLFVLLTATLLFLFINRLYNTSRRLLENESSLKAIFDNGTELICVVDRELKIKMFNKRFYDTYKKFLNKEIAQGESFLNIYSDEAELEMFKSRIQRVLSGESFSVERHVKIHNKEIYLDVFYKPVFEKKEITGFVVSIIDITEYKKAQTELELTFHRSEEIFNSSTDALFITDTNNRFIVDCNSTALELFEADSKEMLIGKTGPQLHRYPLPNETALEITEKISRNEPLSYEFEYSTFKGNHFWGAFSAKCIKTAQGNINLVRISDITAKKESELKIKETELRFKQLADSSPAMLWISDTDGKIRFYNQAWLYFRGITLDEEIDYGWKNGIHPEDYDRLIKDIYNPAIENKSGYKVEYRLQRRDGAYRWVLENAVPKFNEKGEFEGLFGSAIDIDELKQIQQKIVESETRFRELADSSPVMLWTADVNGAITFYNSAWLNFTGRNIDEEIGNGWIDGVHPDDIVPFVHNVYFESFKSHKPYLVEYRLRRFDGEYRWILEAGSPKTNANGEFEGMVGSAIDITDRKIAEIKLKQQEKFNSRISELSPDFIYIYDLVLKQTIYSNRLFTQLLGYTTEEYNTFNEKVFVELIHPDDLNSVKYTEDYFKKFEKSNLIDLEFRMKSKNGDWKWVHTRETIFSFDNDGKPLQILGNARDITEKKLAEENIINTNTELKAINEELDSFVYRASHDLRAPLSSVLGLINLAKTEVKEANAVFYFEMIQKSIQKLTDVTQDLIDHARNASVEISAEVIDFYKIINDIIEGMRYHENAKRIKFEIDINSKVKFKSDRLRIILLFNNLISNAIKYHDMSKEAPFVGVKVTFKDGNALIVVSDNGL